jgi:GNAT superfamily N-acetyltransferase
MVITPDYEIVPARLKDIPILPSIELAAATLLVGYAPQSTLAETSSQAELEDAQKNGRLFVVLRNDVPVGFAHVEVLEPNIAHLSEIDVHPEHAGRGLGRRLVSAVCDWATAAGCESLTLTTFSDVPFNMPFYARLGFEVIPFEELSPALLSVLRDETRRNATDSWLSRAR